MANKTFNVQQAIKDGYTPEEIRAFLKENPNVNAPGFSVDNKPVDGLLGSLINPFINVGKNVLGAGYEAIRGGATALAPLVGVKGENQYSLYVDPKTGEAKQNPFLTEQQLSAYDSGATGLENIGRQAVTANSGLQRGVKDSAQVASYAVPFGKGGNLLSKALLPGAAVGLTQGLSQDDVTARGVAMSTAGGAIGGGLLHGAGILGSKAGGKLVGAGEKLLDKSAANFMKASPGVFEKASEHFNINKSFQKYFKPGDKIDDLIGAIGTKNEGKISSLLGESEAIIDKTIKNSGDDIIATADDLIKPLTKKLEKLSKVAGNENKVNELNKFIAEVKKLYPKGLTSKKLLEVKRIYDEQFGKSVVNDTTGAVIRDSQKSLANTSRGILKDTFGSIKNALDNESELITMRPIFSKARAVAETTGLKQPGGIGLLDMILGLGGAATGNPLAGAGLIAGRKILQSPQALGVMGKAAQKVGGASLPASTSNVLNQILSQGAARGGAAATNSVFGGTEQLPVNQSQNQNYPTDQVAPPVTTTQDTITQQPDVTQQSKYTLEQLGQMYNNATMAGDTKAADRIKEMYVMQKDVESLSGGGKKTDKQISEDAVQKLAKEATTLLASGIKTGMVAGPLEQQKARLGMADQKTLDFNTMIGGLKATIAKARAGTSFTPNEEKLLNTYVPVVGDSKQQLETKLRLLQTDQGKTAIQVLMNPVVTTQQQDQSL